MKINLEIIDGVSIAEIISDAVVIADTQDALDIMADCSYNGSSSIIIHQKNLAPEFFDLKTGIAGDILQKFSTYNLKLAIVGDYGNIKSKSLNDFIFESNKYGRVNFVATKADALKKLCR